MHTSPELTFVCQLQNIDGRTLSMAQDSSSRILCILPSSINDYPHLPSCSKSESHYLDFMIPASLLLEPELPELLLRLKGHRLWLEVLPSCMAADSDVVLKKTKKLIQEFEVLPVLGAASDLSELLDIYPELPGCVLRGNDAAGFVGRESSFSLFSAAYHLLNGRQQQPILHVWGGIGTPEAAAAFLAAGATGIVLESLHWCTDIGEIPSSLQQKLARLGPDQCELLGLSVGAPCRLFDKGNSVAVKDARQQEISLSSQGIVKSSGANFAKYVLDRVIAPAQSTFSKEELIPLGVEATFAASFAKRYGTDFVRANVLFKEDIRQCLGTTQERLRCFVASDVAEAMGTDYPIFQGAMSWISDEPDFALAVAKSGAMPTLALGLMNRERLVERFGDLKQVMGDVPFAVNVLALSENPFRDEQVQWILEEKPPFVVIAAGEPQFARQFLGTGIEPVYIAPSPELFEIASAMGVRYFICEGNESGGHNGVYGTFTLAQVLLNLKRDKPDLFQGRTIILAGGICDRLSSFMAAMVGANAIQMGTAYLTTREIVSTNALSQVFQDMVLRAGMGATTVTGSSVGLRVRSLKNEKVERIHHLEQRYAQGLEPKEAFRAKMELLASGSLFSAAKSRTFPDGEELSCEECSCQGQFMSGVCAELLNKPMSISELHQEVVGGSWNPLRKNITQKFDQPENLADRNIVITGLSVVNSLGLNPTQFLEASLAMKTGVRATSGIIEHFDFFYDPTPMRSGKTYSRAGAFMDLEVDRRTIGVPPQDFRTMSKSTKTTLLLAKQAIEDSGFIEAGIAPERIGVVISQNSGESSKALADLIMHGAFPNIVEIVNSIKPLTSSECEEIQSEFQTRFLNYDDTTMLGRLSFTAGGHICNKYGFNGPGQAITAACGSSLAAIFVAVQMLRNDILDVALVGGGEEGLSMEHYLEFSPIGALAGVSGAMRLPAQESRPFDANRDGMVLGEGGGMIVLERESLARSRGARIYARLAGVGGGNSSDGLVESSRESQMRAIRASFDDAGYTPDTIDLVECHATSTRQGDLEEVMALRELFDSKHKRTILASLKSQTGHTLGAAGINSLIRGVLTMNAGYYPGTLNYDTPDPEMDLHGTGLEILTKPEAWESCADHPRRFQVNAFGFGGANYVMQVEQVESGDMKSSGQTTPDSYSSEQLSVSSLNPPPDGVFLFSYQEGELRFRIANTSSSEEEARQELENLKSISLSKLSQKRKRTFARQGIYVGRESEPAPVFAMIFPGQGSQYANMGKELYQSIPVIREWIDRADLLADFSLKKCLFEAEAEELQRTSRLQPCLFALEYGLARWFMSMGARPAVLAGHSLGELTALCVAGVFSFEDGLQLVARRGKWMESIANAQDVPTSMMATDMPLERLMVVLDDFPGVCVSNVNAPNQMVIGGELEQLKLVGGCLKNQDSRSVLLPVSMAFHSPIISSARSTWAEVLDDVNFSSPAIPVISNSTGQPYPDAPQAIKELLLTHAERQVLWMDSVITMSKEYGVSLFLEAGPREVLGGLVADILPSAISVPVCLPSVEVVSANNTVAQLGAMGILIWDGVVPLVQGHSLGKPKSFPATSAVGASASSTKSCPVEVRDIVQQEINSFMFECFGQILKPKIVSALQKHGHGPVSVDDLDVMLRDMLSNSDHEQGQLKPVMPVQMPVSEVGKNASSSQSVLLPDEELDIASLGVEGVQQHIIQAIMDATGYERDEIDADMDLREDLAIRSSRLPVIMDNLEQRFNLQLHMEDFIDARSVRDLAEIIIRLLQNPAKAKAAGDARRQAQKPKDGSDTTIHRVTFAPVHAEVVDYRPLVLQAMDTVAVIRTNGSKSMADEVDDILQRDYGAESLFLDWNFDCDSKEDPAKTIDGLLESIREKDSLAGLILVLDGVERLNSLSTTDVDMTSKSVECFVQILQTALQARGLRFALVMVRNGELCSTSDMFVQSMNGLFLSASLEKDDILYRVIYQDKATDISHALREGFNLGHRQVELQFTENKTQTICGSAVPYRLPVVSAITLGSDDLIVFTGGGRGITPLLAKGLRAYGCKVALLGRTDISELKEDASEQEKARRQVVLDSLAALRGDGMEVSYHTCDVRDAAQCERVMKELAEQHGNICGVVHGAGVLRDCLLDNMTQEDLQLVMQVKVQGAWNVLQAAHGHGLRFFLVLSSIAAVVGNRGQTNYTAANRLMSAMLEKYALQQPKLMLKSLCLPPVEGAGMAEQSVVRDFLERLGIGYVHVDELAQLLIREVLSPPDEASSVLLLRSLPEFPTGPSLNLDGACSHSAGTCFEPAAYPLVDVVSSIDIRQGRLQAERVFSLEHDLWLEDHKPITNRGAIVSAIMMVEALQEGGALLYPHLSLRGVRDVWFLSMIECLPDKVRPCTIECAYRGIEQGEVVCDASLGTFAESTSENIQEVQNKRTEPACKGALIFSASNADPFGPESETYLDFLFERGTTQIMHGADEIKKLLMNHTRLKGRYMVLDECHFCSGEGVWGVIHYKEGQDFAPFDQTHYAYSPYLLEAMFHLIVISIISQAQEPSSGLLPVSIGELRFARKCISGERLELEVQTKGIKGKRFLYDARALDSKGETVAMARDIAFMEYQE